MKGFCCLVGRTGQRPAIEDVVREVASRRKEKTELQLSPKRSKEALGIAEASNFAVESQLRTMRLGLLARYPQEKVCGENMVVAWMVRHCGWLLARFQMRQDAVLLKNGQGVQTRDLRIR